MLNLFEVFVSLYWIVKYVYVKINMYVTLVFVVIMVVHSILLSLVELLVLDSSLQNSFTAGYNIYTLTIPRFAHW